MQNDVIEHAAEQIAAVRRVDRLFHGLADGAAERAARAGMLCQNFTARLGGIGGRRNDVRPVGADDFLALRFLFAGDFDHIHGQIDAVECRRHRERRCHCPGQG